VNPESPQRRARSPPPCGTSVRSCPCSRRAPVQPHEHRVALAVGELQPGQLLRLQQHFLRDTVLLLLLLHHSPERARKYRRSNRGSRKPADERPATNTDISAPLITFCMRLPCGRTNRLTGRGPVKTHRTVGPDHCRPAPLTRRLVTRRAPAGTSTCANE
jgi:hypothetical protein